MTHADRASTSAPSTDLPTDEDHAVFALAGARLLSAPSAAAREVLKLLIPDAEERATELARAQERLSRPKPIPEPEYHDLEMYPGVTCRWWGPLPEPVEREPPPGPTWAEREPVELPRYLANLPTVAPAAGDRSVFVLVNEQGWAAAVGDTPASCVRSFARHHLNAYAENWDSALDRTSHHEDPVVDLRNWLEPYEMLQLDVPNSPHGRGVLESLFSDGGYVGSCSELEDFWPDEPGGTA